MKYDEKKFNSAVEEYKKSLGNVKAKSFFVVFDIKNKKAFFSIAPLSRAIQGLDADMNVTGIDKKSEGLDALKDVWEVFKQNKDGKSDEKTEALVDFVEEVEKKAEGKFIGLFKAPDYILEAKESGFQGDFALPFRNDWFKDYKAKELDETCKKIWTDVYNLKSNERVSIGFVLIQKDEMLGHPLEDYLDSYAISWHAMLNCKNISKAVTMGSSTQRMSMLDKAENISELRVTLLGCELCKDSDEEIFKKYKKVSGLLNLGRIKSADVMFSLAGKGYPGKHLFGEINGYPSLNGKTRWQSPGQMIYKLDYSPQTALDDRNPLARIGFTETLPIDVFIETCNIDWKKMRDRNWKIKEIEDKCSIIKVSGEETNGLKTDLEVGLIRKDGIHRWVRTSDTDVREKINEGYLKVILIIEVLGRPAEHVTDALKKILAVMKSDKNLIILEKKAYKPKRAKNARDLFTSFMEIEALAKGMRGLYDICLDYMPSSIEIIEPSELRMNLHQANSVVNEFVGRLHKHNEVSNKLASENQILRAKLQEAFRGRVIIENEGLKTEFGKKEDSVPGEHEAGSAGHKAQEEKSADAGAEKNVHKGGEEQEKQEK